MCDCLVKCLVAPGAVVPVYQTPGAAGADLCACLASSVTLLPGAHALVPTGLRFEIPPGYEMQVRPRSGLAAKAGVTVLNSPGTIDSDYRGEVQVILVNHGAVPFIVNHGDRIAQVIIAPVIQARFSAADALGGTERGEGGFGSTGNDSYPRVCSANIDGHRGSVT
jgi:dUTP pyrophosphatase